MIESVIEKRLNEIKLAVETDKLSREHRLEPWKLIIAGLAAGGTIFAGGAAALGLLLHAMGKL